MLKTKKYEKQLDEFLGDNYNEYIYVDYMGFEYSDALTVSLVRETSYDGFGWSTWSDRVGYKISIHD